MFSLVVQMEVRPGRREEFLAGMAANAEASVRDEPGVPAVRLCGVAADENRFVLYELYTDADGVRGAQGVPALRAVAARSPSEVVAGQVNTPGALLVTHTAEESA